MSSPSIAGSDNLWAGLGSLSDVPEVWDLTADSQEQPAQEDNNGDGGERQGRQGTSVVAPPRAEAVKKGVLASPLRRNVLHEGSAPRLQAEAEMDKENIIDEEQLRKLDTDEQARKRKLALLEAELWNDEAEASNARISPPSKKQSSSLAASHERIQALQQTTSSMHNWQPAFHDPCEPYAGTDLTQLQREQFRGKKYIIIDGTQVEYNPRRDKEFEEWVAEQESLEKQAQGRAHLSSGESPDRARQTLAILDESKEQGALRRQPPFGGPSSSRTMGESHSDLGPSPASTTSKRLASLKKDLHASVRDSEPRRTDSAEPTDVVCVSSGSEEEEEGSRERRTSAASTSRERDRTKQMPKSAKRTITDAAPNGSKGKPKSASKAAMPDLSASTSAKYRQSRLDVFMTPREEIETARRMRATSGQRRGRSPARTNFSEDDDDDEVHFVSPRERESLTARSPSTSRRLSAPVPQHKSAALHPPSSSPIVALEADPPPARKITDQETEERDYYFDDQDNDALDWEALEAAEADGGAAASANRPSLARDLEVIRMTRISSLDPERARGYLEQFVTRERGTSLTQSKRGNKRGKTWNDVHGEDADSGNGDEDEEMGAGTSSTGRRGRGGKGKATGKKAAKSKYNPYKKGNSARGRGRGRGRGKGK